MSPAQQVVPELSNNDISSTDAHPVVVFELSVQTCDWTTFWRVFDQMSEPGRAAGDQLRAPNSAGPRPAQPGPEAEERQLEGPAVGDRPFTLYAQEGSANDLSGAHSQRSQREHRLHTKSANACCTQCSCFHFSCLHHPCIRGLVWKRRNRK